MNIDELIENFELLDDWEDKYRYIIDLGNGLEPLDEQFKTEEWKVRGCQSQVWLLPSRQGDKIHFRGDSDAVIVKGLIAIVLMIYSDKSPSEIKAVAVEDIFAKLGLGEHLSRRNGLIAMTEKIKYYAGIL